MKFHLNTKLNKKIENENFKTTVCRKDVKLQVKIISVFIFFSHFI